MDKEQKIVKKAKKFATKTFHRPFSDTPDEPITIIEPDRYEGYLGGYKDGYEEAKAEFKKMIKQYEKQGNKCLSQSAENSETEHCHFWDGFKSCAENILRDLKDDIVGANKI